MRLRRWRDTVPWRSLRYCALDFETTGLDVATDAVLSFGAVPIDDGRPHLDASCYRIADPGRPVPDEVVAIHGIRPADVAAAPPLAAVVGELSAAVTGRTLVVWTAWVEAAFLAKTLGGSAGRWRRTMIDVRNLVIRLDDENGLISSPARDASLMETAERMGVPAGVAHDALADAFVTAQVFVVVATRLSVARSLDAGALRRLGSAPPPAAR